MKVSICYEEGHSTVSDRCRVYGMSPDAASIEPGWTVYAVYEMPDTPRLAMELIDALAKFNVEYHDPSFASVVPESANVTAGLVDMILARSDFAEMPYTSLTRQWRAESWTEISRRKVPSSEVRLP